MCFCGQGVVISLVWKLRAFPMRDLQQISGSTWALDQDRTTQRELWLNRELRDDWQTGRRICLGRRVVNCREQQVQDLDWCLFGPQDEQRDCAARTA